MKALKSITIPKLKFRREAGKPIKKGELPPDVLERLQKAKKISVDPERKSENSKSGKKGSSD